VQGNYRRCWEVDAIKLDSRFVKHFAERQANRTVFDLMDVRGRNRW